VRLVLTPEDIQARIEEDRRIHADRPGVRPTDYTFMKKFGRFVAMAPDTGPKADGRKEFPLRSEAMKRLIGDELKRFFAGMEARDLLTVTSIVRNGIFGRDDAAPPKERFVPREWLVRVDVGPAATDRGFCPSVTFAFDEIEGDWYVTAMLCHGIPRPAPP
jgi:hypothetical protein